jgi:hypothetical protein
MKIQMEVPPPNEDSTRYFKYINPNNIKHIDVSEVPESDKWESENIYTYELSDNIFPYAKAFRNSDEFQTEIFKGKFNAIIGDYVLDEEKTIMCTVTEHDSVEIKLPTNEYTASSFKRNITNDSFLDIILFLTFKVTKEGEKYILHGNIHGGALFNDIHKVGKYMDLIHPEVGDIVTIGFPNENSRQQYEITDCTDKKITNDGINPLLGQYVWLCKAKRYVPSGENLPEVNEDNQRIEEKIDMLNNIDEIIARDIASYDEDENDDVYGGYERELKPYDKRKVDYHKSELTEFEDDGSFIEIFSFHDKSKLVTDGYDLYYITSDNEAFKMTTVYDEIPDMPPKKYYGNQYLKSTDNAVYFINFDNKSCKLCEDSEITKGEVEVCLNSLVDATYQVDDNNKSG